MCGNDRMIICCCVFVRVSAERVVALTTDKVFKEFAQAELAQTVVSTKARIQSNNVFEDLPKDAAETLASFFRKDYAKEVSTADPPAKLTAGERFSWYP